MKILSALLVFTFCSCATPSEPTANKLDFNQHTLAAIQTMPQGGGYSGTDATKNLLAKACRITPKGLSISPNLARPSFCSGATYLVFLEALSASQSLSPQISALLTPSLDQKDGYGLFGRWNANGPGSAKLIIDLEMGENFTSWGQAQPGDFLKIWWNEHIGQRERGHLVIYLKHDAETVTFWSSNQPNGYGQKTVPLAKCRRALFTRITKPENISNAPQLPPHDPFLVDMLRKDFTWSQVQKACRVRD